MIDRGSYHVPEERVENDGDHSDAKAGVIDVDVFSEFLYQCQVHLRKIRM